MQFSNLSFKSCRHKEAEIIDGERVVKLFNRWEIRQNMLFNLFICIIGNGHQYVYCVILTMV